MNVINLLVCLLYLATAFIVAYLYKLSANQVTPSLDKTKRVVSTQSLYLTVSRFFVYRYTFLAVATPHKKYLSMQLLTISIFSVALLRINRIMFYQLIASPLCLIGTLVANDIWMFRKQAERHYEEQGQVAVQHRWITMEPEQIIRSVVTGFTIGLLCISAYRINMSLSNLGELNIESLLIGMAVDQLLIRPLAILLTIAAIGVARAIVGSQITQWTVLREIVNQECLRQQNKHLFIQTIQTSQVEQKTTSDKTSSPLRLPKVSQKCSNQEPDSSEGTLADLLKLNSSFHKSDLEEIRVEDIEIDDKIGDQEMNQLDMTSKAESHHKQDQDQQLEMQDFGVLKQKNGNNDIYLPNLWESKDLDLPVSIENSRQHKRGRIKKRRVLTLSGNSPYLQYLPNMLKKQESENKLKTQSKSILQNKLHQSKIK